MPAYVPNTYKTSYEEFTESAQPLELTQHELWNVTDIPIATTAGCACGGLLYYASDNSISLLVCIDPTTNRKYRSWALTLLGVPEGQTTTHVATWQGGVAFARAGTIYRFDPNSQTVQLIASPPANESSVTWLGVMDQTLYVAYRRTFVKIDDATNHSTAFTLAKDHKFSNSPLLLDALVMRTSTDVFNNSKT